MPASLPPSSSVRRFSVLAALDITFLPVEAEPVNTILPMPSCDDIAAPMVSSPAMPLTTPAGSTSFISSIIRSVDSGVYGEGLFTTVLPARIAGMMCQIAISTGQFHGVIEPTTPIGRRCNSMRPSLLSWITFTGISRSAV